MWFRKPPVQALAEVQTSNAVAGECTGDAREKPCRQTFVILQHEDLRRETSEFRSHARAHSNFSKSGQLFCNGQRLNRRPAAPLVVQIVIQAGSRLEAAAGNDRRADPAALTARSQCRA